MASEKAAGKMSHGNPGTEHFGSRSLDSEIIFLSGAVAFFSFAGIGGRVLRVYSKTPVGRCFFNSDQIVTTNSRGCDRLRV